MKYVHIGLLALASALSAPGLANRWTEDEVLHATFVAFQEPGVFSSEEISNSRKLLADAASTGSSAAQSVIAMQEDRTVSAKSSTDQRLTPVEEP